MNIEPYQAARLGEAASVLARAFLSNPLHVAAFGPAPVDRNEVFFKLGLRVMKGPTFLARDGDRIAGVIHWVTAPLCQFSPWEKLRQVPAMIRGVGPASAARLGSWLAAWGRHDPAEPHIHLGPIGVDPAYQGKNVGRLLMEAYCAELDRGGVKGYLETDRAENVTFYQRFGFQVTREAPVLGVTNYFMTR